MGVTAHYIKEMENTSQGYKGMPKGHVFQWFASVQFTKTVPSLQPRVLYQYQAVPCTVS